jgi:hypothetical protein
MLDRYNHVHTTMIFKVHRRNRIAFAIAALIIVGGASLLALFLDVGAPRSSIVVPRLPRQATLSRAELYDRLVQAATEPNVAEVHRLLQEGADPNADPNYPILIRLLHDTSGFYEAVPMLLEFGANVNVVDEQGL